MERRWWPAVLVLASLGAIAACGGGTSDDPAATPTQPGAATGTVRATPTPETTASPTATAPRTAFGVAGLIPPHFPDASGEDWTHLFRTLGETGSLLGVYTNWADSELLASDPPAVFETAYGAAQGVTIVAGMGLTRTSAPGRIELTLDFENRTDVAAFLTAIHALVITYHVEYLAIGGEMNLLAAQDAAAFDSFVDLYGRTYDIVKVASPRTKVFPVFQYEHMHGGAYLIDGIADRTPTLELLDRFAGRMDLVGLTTYPFFDYRSPADIPDDYYRDAAERAGVPLAFTEVGWPAAPLSAAPESEFGGSPEEQAAFVDRFGELIEGLPLEFALWAFPNDPAGVAAPFEAVALRDNDGMPRPALDAWAALSR